MAKQSKTILLAYNKCAELATRFQNILDSFWHKDEKIPLSSIDGDFSPFTETQEDRLKALVYENATQTLTANPTFSEKGVDTQITYTWNVNDNDDTLISVDLDENNVLADADGTNTTYQKNSNSTITITLATVVNRNGQNIAINTPRQVPFYIPQYIGKTADLEPDYAHESLGDFTKKVQSSTNLSVEITLNDEYLFFIVNSNSKQPKDNLTGFNLSIGEWNSTTAFFIKKTVTITLADGSTENATICRTREKRSQTLNISLV
jgi:hypothetical protein